MGGMGLQSEGNMRITGAGSNMHDQSMPTAHSEMYGNPSGAPQYMDRQKQDDFLRQQSVATTSADGSDIGLFGAGLQSNTANSNNVTPQRAAAPQMNAQPQPMFDYHMPQGNNFQQQQAYEPPPQMQPRLPQNVFAWRHGGNDVQIIGSFNKWQQRIPMQKMPDGTFTVVQELPPGFHQYKFIVDGEWRCAHDQDKVRDQAGNENNQVFVKQEQVVPV